MLEVMTDDGDGDGVDDEDDGDNDADGGGGDDDGCVCGGVWNVMDAEDGYDDKEMDG